ncbi:hypothetical protein G5C60_25360 [Streptomyces sp. HC44]|uniref:Uncharacterized protein n=1 Tax=Streptomyces scabichelini TaxID=2711217 RepID=A0A6G4V9N7_9ACTN|nr:hypothetical protein [Streptomyces scabichelini]NGO10832.1 hypothetical protein [Streptomyces scabichelini]
MTSDTGSGGSASGQPERPRMTARDWRTCGGCWVFLALIGGLIWLGVSCDPGPSEPGDRCYDVGETVTSSAGETLVCR